MIDMGLATGAKSLWEENLLFDYTIKVEDREFRAHKMALASVSEYFRVMFTGSMRESQTDRVELKELSADTFSKLLDLIYTGDEDIVTENAAELFPCAVYLEVRSAIEECKLQLLDKINESNCLDILSLLLTYGEPSDADKVKVFINQNWKKVFGKCKPKDLTYDVLVALTGIWRESEWELFQFIKDWIDVDNESRVRCTNGLMKEIRFCLMTPQEVAAIKKTPVYKNSADSWKELVDSAATYHKLPIHNKVLEVSQQTSARGEAEPVFFTENNHKGSKTCVMLNGITRQWEKHSVKGPKFSSAIGGTIHVNNFLICYTELDKGKTDWYIFDARTLKWSEMASMSRPKTDFALVHHGECLYVIGGITDTGSLTQSVERYDFNTNTWKSTGKRMLIPGAKQSACVLGNAVYCCSGYVQNEGLCISSKRMDRLDLSTHTWESRAPMSVVDDRPSELCVMKISGEDILVFVRKYQVDTYNPFTDQWSPWNILTTLFRMFRWDELSWNMTQDGAIYLLNIIQINIETDSDSDSSSDDDFFHMFNGRLQRICCRWTMDEGFNLPFKLPLNSMPIPQLRAGKDEDMFGAVLALPYHKLK